MSRYSFVDEWFVPAPRSGCTSFCPAQVRKPLVRHLAPVLRPVFAWNHRWAMRRGQERILALVADGPRERAVSAG